MSENLHSKVRMDNTKRFITIYDFTDQSMQMHGRVSGSRLATFWRVRTWRWFDEIDIFYRLLEIGPLFHLSPKDTTENRKNNQLFAKEGHMPLGMDGCFQAHSTGKAIWVIRQATLRNLAQLC